MKKSTIQFLPFACAAFFALELSAPAADSLIIAPGAELKKIVDDCKFTEGPACDADGNVYFTDQPNDRILKYDTDGGIL